MPRAVICSPSHIRNMVPPTSVVTQETRKNRPGSSTAAPKEPRMLYVRTGKSVDAAGAVVDPYTRWVVYVPFATGETTGLATRPAGPGVPWLMDPGTGGAHIMISPPRP